MPESRYITAKDAAAELGVSVATIYVYVSRGLIRSESSGDNYRTHRYYWEDVQKLKERRDLRHHPDKAAENALHWGMPVMESAITLIEQGRLYYRGQDAIKLAQERSVEEVAALIWTNDITQVDSLFSSEISGVSSQVAALASVLTGLPPVEQFQVVLPLVANGDLAAYDLRPAAIAQTGARILRTLVMITSRARAVRDPIAQLLQHAWVSDDANAAYLLNAALILCADHELNVSAFTARCVASSGATPYQVVYAGLAALQGVKHGGNVDRVEAFMREAGDAPSVKTAIVGRLKRGEEIPGFEHRLYPEGDPRGQLLYDLLRHHSPNHPAIELTESVVQHTRELRGEHFNIDLARALLVRVLKLPVGAGIAIFALGRTIGWIGHAIEQYQTNQIIRPRARYIGEPPAR